jgi:hypothetical protein
METYVPPRRLSDAFNCPNCRAFSHQTWKDLGYGRKTGAGYFHDGILETFSVSFCSRCKKFALWDLVGMIYPLSSHAPSPTVDMPKDVGDDFAEARNIANFSPRAAVALLRLALQKLMPHLGENGKDLNEDIASLVKKGLPEKIQQALDAIRVIGNNAVHPGQIDIKDDKQTAIALFDLLNIIVDTMVTQPKRIRKIYEAVPESARKAIEERDNKS